MAHAQPHEHGEAHPAVGHLVSPKILITNTAALLVLTVITVLVAQMDFTRYNMYEMNILVAMAVAVVKASLVCLFFMHLWWDRPFNSFVLVTSIAFVGLFVVLAMTDTFEYRGDILPGDPPGVTSRLGELQR
jgi:cytochrome c oxidase subunit IV